MNTGEVRILAVEGKDLNADTARHLANLFKGIAGDPSKAKEARSRFVLEFPDFESDPRPNYAVSEVREFVGTLDRECPYAAYFLNGDPAMSHIQFYLLCLIKLHRDEKGWQYDPRDLVAAALERYDPVADLCRRIGVDEELGTDGLLLSLPAEALAGNKEAAAKVLRALKPALKALKRDFDHLTLRPDGRAIIRDLLSRGAILSGLDPGNRMDEALLDKILKRLP